MTTKYARNDSQRAEMDALSAIARDLPIPAAYARTIETGAPVIAEMLRQSYRANDNENRGYLRAHAEHVLHLRPLGLVECGGPCLTVFGMQVRKALICEENFFG